MRRKHNPTEDITEYLSWFMQLAESSDEYRRECRKLAMAALKDFSIHGEGHADKSSWPRSL